MGGEISVGADPYYYDPWWGWGDGYYRHGRHRGGLGLSWGDYDPWWDEYEPYHHHHRHHWGGIGKQSDPLMAGNDGEHSWGGQESSYGEDGGSGWKDAGVSGGNKRGKLGQLQIGILFKIFVILMIIMAILVILWIVVRVVSAYGRYRNSFGRDF
jgi:hypothetical protein